MAIAVNVPISLVILNEEYEHTKAKRQNQRIGHNRSPDGIKGVANASSMESINSSRARWYLVRYASRLSSRHRSFPGRSFR